MNGTTDNLGGNLVFLVSQPRAGSTLLQRILGGHPQIHTTSEPWFMLAPCYALKTEGHWADYEAGGWARLARDEFLKGIGGREVHVRGIREMAHSVYRCALAGSGKNRFLDKTPRYYAILPELAEVFPAARFVILLRNPLAVLCSVVRTWVQTHWERMPSYRDDLLKAPGLLARGIEILQERGQVRVLRYEDLVADPATQVHGLCDWLGVPFVPAMLEYGKGAAPAFAFGDPQGIQGHAAADASHTARWTDDIRDATLWRFCSDYLQHLERDVPGLLGYDRTALHAALAPHRPSAWRAKLGRSLDGVLKANVQLPGAGPR